MNRTASLIVPLLAALSIALSGCSQPDRATQVLSSQGFKDIVIHPVGLADAFSCSEGDNFYTPFTARGPGGATVNGVVCSGFLKGATVRFR
jgi:hypothetical protein